MGKRIWCFLLATLLSLTLILPAGAEEATASQTQDRSGYTVILHTNDVHGTIDNYAVVAGLKQDYEARGASVLLLDAGDFIQGNSSVSINKGKNAVELMNLAGYDCAAVGNHEFDYGYDQLAELQEEMQFPLLSINVMKGENPDQMESVFQNDAIFTLSNGKTVGVFGISTPDSKTSSIGGKDFTFLQGDALYDCTQKEVDALKTEKGCDLVVCLSHMGLHVLSNCCTDLLDHVTGIDYMLDGHSHEALSAYEEILDAKGKYNGTVLTSTGTQLEYVGILEIAPDGTETISCTPVEELTVTPNAAVAKKTSEIRVAVDKDSGVVVGKTEVLLDGSKETNRVEETNLGDLITDAMVWKMDQLGHPVDAAIENGGGIRESIPVGDVTKKMVKDVLPYLNTICVISVTGEDLLEALEASTCGTPVLMGAFPQVSGISYVLNLGAEFEPAENYPESTYPAPAAINRVTILTVGGEAFDPEKTYRIATNDYLAEGGDSYYVFSQNGIPTDSGISLDEAVAEFIQEALGGSVGQRYAAPAGRITEVLYPDVKASDWFTTAVYYNTLTEIMAGTDKGFEPNAPLNRAMMVTTLYRMAGTPALEEGTENPFTDVEEGQWYTDAILWASENGIANGKSEGKFDPLGKMTREQMASFLYRYARYAAYPIEESTPVGALAANYPDGSRVTDYAVPAVLWATRTGLLTGTETGNLEPQGTSTRAQVATVLMRYQVNNTGDVNRTE